MKKSGFTMIELIFVIVILGVLAAVAIPKLNATRDDAEQAKAMTNLATLMGDLTSFYTSQGEFKADISAMTNVPLTEQDGTNKGKFDYMIKNEKCLTFETAGAALVITPNKTASQKVCQNVLTNTSTQNIIRGTYTCETDITTSNAETPTATAGALTVNDKKAGNTGSIANACKDTTPGLFGKPSPLAKSATYHNVISTQLGKVLDAATGDLTQKTEVKDFEPVIMSFEGAGVAF